MARYWTFLDFVDASGTNVIHAWLHSLPAAARAKMNTIIQYLEVTERLGMPYTKALKGDCAGLVEIRVGFQRIEYRLLGCYGPGPQEFTMLVGAIERGGRFEPLSACSTGHLRKRQINQEGRTCEHDFS